jgi:hypothetical protein
MAFRFWWVAAVALLAGCAPVTHTAGAPISETATPVQTVRVAKPPTRITYPARGRRRWTFAAAQSTPPAGTSGRLMRYRVAVERDIQGLTASAFATAVTATLSDPRGWTGGGQWRLRRVGAGSAYDFTVYLVTPGTRNALCGGTPDGYTSCRNGAKVVLNVARWVTGVPHYGASLAVYRQYMVNHEVGHRLGHGHELCPGKGAPAPVMLQQTLGRHGCVANAWPYVDGELYAGPSGVYHDQVPPERTTFRG